MYGPEQNQNQNSSVKMKILHADLVDKDGLMTITTTINDSLINRFGDLFFPGKSVRLTGFELKKKGPV